MKRLPLGELRKREATRFRCRAHVRRFGTDGRYLTICLGTVVAVDNGAALAEEVWYRKGAWSLNLRKGDRIEFNAESVLHQTRKGRPFWRLERPTKITRLPDPRIYVPPGPELILPPLDHSD